MRNILKAIISIVFNNYFPRVYAGFLDENGGVIGREKTGDGFAPFDDDDVVWVREVIGEVVRHKARVGKAIEIVMDETAFIVKQGVGF